MVSLVTVSNGTEFLRIDANDLQDAAEDGFYRPLERGLTIVGNSEHLFEIPLTDVDAAKLNGYVDLLEHERTPARVVSPRVIQPVAAPATTTYEPPGFIGSGVAEESLVMDGLTQAEQEEEEERLAREQELEEAEGLAWYRVFLRQWIDARSVFLERQIGSHGISIAIHVAIFLLLASLVMVTDNEQKNVLIASAPSSADMVEEVEIQAETLEITDPTETQETEAPPETAEVELVTEAVTSMDFMASVSGAAVTAPAVKSKDKGTGLKIPKRQSSVFGTKTAANDYVFVIDNSNSMVKGRFETALHELMIAVQGLNKKQRFYVIFYSDTAYGMMYPNPVTQMVYATNQNKQRLYSWLMTVPMCLKTNGKEAIQAAFEMKPDVIYVLGDGAFGDGASRYFAAQPKGKTILHTRGMQVSPQLAKSFEALAKAHGGNYKDVGVLPAAAVLAQRNPRPRLRVKTGVWGLMLQPNAK